MDNNFVDKILTITKDEDYLDNPEKQAKVKEYKEIKTPLLKRDCDLKEKTAKVHNHIGLF